MTTTKSRPYWPAIERAAIAGVHPADLCRKYGVTLAALRKQSQRNKWPVPNRILKRAKELSQVVPGDILETAAENWLAQGQAANGYALRILRTKLERAASRPDSIDDLADVEDIATAAKMARTCAGLDAAVSLNLHQHQHSHRVETPALLRLQALPIHSAGESLAAVDEAEWAEISD